MKPFIVRIGTLAATGTLAGGLALAVSGTAFATGQPNQSCQAEPSSPGNAASAPGSAFNEDPGGVAGAVYAGNGAPSLNANSGNAVSQYDVACFQVSQH
jgi:hypothetical protein